MALIASLIKSTGLLGSFYHLAHRLKGGVKVPADGALRISVLKHLKRDHRVNFTQVVFKPQRGAPKSVGVVNISRGRSPLQVLHSIVQTVGVKMINHFTFLWCPNESCGYKPMNTNRATLPFPRQRYSYVASKHSRFNWSGDMPNVAKITYFVQTTPRLKGDGSPSFLGHHLSPSFTVGG